MSNGVMGVTLVYSTMAAVLNYFTPLRLWNTKANGAHKVPIHETSAEEQVAFPNIRTQSFYFRSYLSDPTRLHLACTPRSEYLWMIQLLCLSFHGSSTGGGGTLLSPLCQSAAMSNYGEELPHCIVSQAIPSWTRLMHK